MLIDYAIGMTSALQPTDGLFIVPMEQLANTVVVTLVFAIIGILLFALAFWIIAKISPISITKELEEDQNSALAIVIGAVIIGIALIVSAAIHG
jgi:putative membrane protein